MTDDDLPKFHCWNKNEMHEDDAKVICAESWREAAADFAERDYHDEPFDEITVCVRLPSGKLAEIGFHAEMELKLYPGIGQLDGKIESRAG